LTLKRGSRGAAQPQPDNRGATQQQPDSRGAAQQQQDSRAAAAAVTWQRRSSTASQRSDSSLQARPENGSNKRQRSHARRHLQGGDSSRSNKHGGRVSFKRCATSTLQHVGLPAPEIYAKLSHHSSHHLIAACDTA